MNFLGTIFDYFNCAITTGLLLFVYIFYLFLYEDTELCTFQYSPMHLFFQMCHCP
jgi:hypothetical protein